MNLNQIISQLKNKGYKVTEPRKVILGVLLKNISSMKTADEIFNLVKEENSKINRSTVYRNIDTLSELDLLYKTIASNGTALVKLRCCSQHHHHLICDKCGTIVVYDNCDTKNYKAFADAKGFELTGHILELHGICSKCRLL